MKQRNTIQDQEACEMTMRLKLAHTYFFKFNFFQEDLTLHFAALFIASKYRMHVYG